MRKPRGAARSRIGAASALLACTWLLAGPAPAEPRASSKPLSSSPFATHSYDYAYDGVDVGHPERAWAGRAFVHPAVAADPGRAVPLVVFLHGINSEGVRHRWMGGGKEGDVRQIVSSLIEAGRIAPVVVAAPSSTSPRNIAVARTSWAGFDLDDFVDRTAERLSGVASIDRSKVVVAGHSGGGCNEGGGLATAAAAPRTPVYAAVAIDVCMDPPVATKLAELRPFTHVVVAWQTITWTKRPLAQFARRFRAEADKAPAAAGVLRELDAMAPKLASPHDAMVPVTLERWLPRLLPPPDAPR